MTLVVTRSALHKQGMLAMLRAGSAGRGALLRVTSRSW